MKKHYFFLVILCVLFQVLCVSGQSKQYAKLSDKSERKEKAIKEGKPWLSPIIAPAYTADAGFLVSAGMLYSFRVNKNDTISQRSTLPATIFYSSKGNFGIRTFLKTFWFEDRLRFNSNLTIRDKDNNYYGKGFEQIDNTHKSDTTTLYHETTASLEIDLIYKLKTSLYAGIKLKPAYAKTNNFAPPVENDPYRSKFDENYFLNGIGAQLAYDTRDVVVNAWEGMFLNVSTLFYDKLWGSKYDFRVVAFDARYYRTLFRKGNVLAFRSYLRSTNGEVPITELSDFSGGKQMRGYLLGHYRDNTMVLGKESGVTPLRSRMETLAKAEWYCGWEQRALEQMLAN